MHFPRLLQETMSRPRKARRRRFPDRTVHGRLCLLDFAEDDVHICEGDALAVDHATILAELGPVLAVHFLAGGPGVPVDGKAPEGLLQSGQLYGSGGTHSSFAGAVRI